MERAAGAHATLIYNEGRDHDYDIGGLDEIVLAEFSEPMPAQELAPYRSSRGQRHGPPSRTGA